MINDLRASLTPHGWNGCSVVEMLTDASEEEEWEGKTMSEHESCKTESVLSVFVRS